MYFQFISDIYYSLELKTNYHFLLLTLSSIQLLHHDIVLNHIIINYFAD